LPRTMLPRSCIKGGGRNRRVCVGNCVGGYVGAGLGLLGVVPRGPIGASTPATSTIGGGGKVRSSRRTKG
jgi:hypothetical protein